MSFLTRLAFVSVLALALSACADSQSLPQYSGPSAEQTASERPAKSTAPSTLYVLNAANPDPTVAVYSDSGKHLLRTVDLGPQNGKRFAGITVDAKGDMVASSAGTLHVYGNRGANITGTLTQSSGFRYITLDNSDNLYTTCGGRDVCEYASLQQKLTRRLKGVPAVAIAVNAAGDVAIDTASESVEVFQPGKTQPSWSISGLGVSNALAFDPSGDLYVATNNSIAVYPKNATSPAQTISLGSGYASALKFDSVGDLYAITGSNSVAVYAPGSDTPVETLTQGLDAPVALAIAGTGRLFVANHGAGSKDLGSVTVYEKLKSKAVTTITNGVAAPTDIAVAP
jgi:glucose/arabinose dehydrogenase